MAPQLPLAAAVRSANDRVKRRDATKSPADATECRRC
jgi:ribosomal protein L40E